MHLLKKKPEMAGTDASPSPPCAHLWSEEGSYGRKN